MERVNDSIQKSLKAIGIVIGIKGYSVDRINVKDLYILFISIIK